MDVLLNKEDGDAEFLRWTINCVNDARTPEELTYFRATAEWNYDQDKNIQLFEKIINLINQKGQML